MLKGVCGADSYRAWANEREDGGVKLDLGDENVMMHGNVLIDARGRERR
jgi:hypothetical protein